MTSLWSHLSDIAAAVVDDEDEADAVYVDGGSDDDGSGVPPTVPVS